MEDATSYWSPLCKLVSQQQCWVRVGVRDGEATDETPWGMMLIMPVAGYLEASGGPVPIRDVEWVEVSLSYLKGGLAGRPLELIDQSEQILSELSESFPTWEVRETTWSIERFFVEEPVRLLHFDNPFFDLQALHQPYV